MKKVIKLGALCLLMVFLLSVLGCSKQVKQESLLIAGSSTLLPYMDKIEEGFKKAHPNILVEIDGGGSAAGIVAVKRHAIDLATISRDIKREEDDKYIRDYLIAKDAIAIVTHPSNSVDNITKDQLRDVFLGTITNWRQLGGADAPISLVGRKKGSTTRKGMEEMVLSNLDFAKGIVSAESADALKKIVADNPNAIGFVALKDMDSNIKTLSVNGVALTKESVLSSHYPISRSFYLVIYDKPKAAVQKFIDYVMGKEGQTILEHEGLIKVN